MASALSMVHFARAIAWSSSLAFETRCGASHGLEALDFGAGLSGFIPFGRNVFGEFADLVGTVPDHPQ